MRKTYLNAVLELARQDERVVFMGSNLGLRGRVTATRRSVSTSSAGPSLLSRSSKRPNGCGSTTTSVTRALTNGNRRQDDLAELFTKHGTWLPVSNEVRMSLRSREIRHDSRS